MKKTFKTILIIFVLITVIGLSSSLLRGLRPSKSSIGGSVNGSVNGDNNNTETPGENEGENPGDNVEDSPTEDTEHVYNEYDVCKLCGRHRAGQLYIDKQPVYDDESYIDLGTFGGMGNEAYFLVLFDQGQDDEVGFYVYYNGSENCDTHYFNNDLMYLTFGSYEDEVFLLSACESSDFSKYDTVSIYLLDESFEHECYDYDADCLCDICESEMHSYIGHVCENCYSSDHECYDSDMDCICEICGSKKHSYIGDTCENCGSSTEHECYDSDVDCACDICGSEKHSYIGNMCENCYSYIEHECYDSDMDCICEKCGSEKHSYVGNICENCYSGGDCSSGCYDSDGDHSCDYCGTCIHIIDSDGSCYYCGFIIGHATDLDSDMACDLCGGDLSDYLSLTETDHRDQDDDGECDFCGTSFCDGTDNNI